MPDAQDALDARIDAYQECQSRTVSGAEADGRAADEVFGRLRGIDHAYRRRQVRLLPQRQQLDDMPIPYWPTGDAS